MPNARTLKRSYNVLQLGMTAANSITGVAALSQASGLWSLNKAAAATVSVLHVPIPPAPKGGLPTNEDAQLSIVEFFYIVGAANFTSAPTIVLNRQTYPGGTGTGTAAVTAGGPAPTLTFAGLDGVGTAIGSHIAVATYAAPYNLVDSDSLIAALTMNEAATSTWQFFGLTATYV